MKAKNANMPTTPKSGNAKGGTVLDCVAGCCRTTVSFASYLRATGSGTGTGVGGGAYGVVVTVVMSTVVPGVVVTVVPGVVVTVAAGVVVTVVPGVSTQEKTHFGISAHE